MTDDDTADEPADDPEESADEQPEETEAAETESESNGASAALTVPVGVKLGSTRTVLTYPDGNGGVEVVQTLTCMTTYDDPITGEERVVYGEDAATEYPDRVEYMLRSGLPEDEDRAALAERFFSELVAENDVPGDSAVVYAIPTIDNQAGLENLNAVIDDSDIGDALVRSFPESLCGALPALGDDLDGLDDIFLAVNMGSTNLEVCAYRHGEQLTPYVTGAVTGNEVDRWIANRIEEETQGRVNVDRETAREYKEQHADFEDFEPFTDVIQQPGGGAHEFTVERGVMEPMDEYLDEVVDEVANSFLSELANDHMKIYQLALSNQVVVTGGMACVPGLLEEFEERLSTELNRDVTVVAPDRPDLAAAEGARRIASRLVDAA